ncbi:NAD(P)H-dependent flavin oxidoreductase [Myroides sp. LJL119]
MNLQQALNLKHYIGLAPMLGVGTPELVGAIANQGALAFLPLGRLPSSQCQSLILKTKGITQKPFGVNLFLHVQAKVDLSQVTQMQDLLAQACELQDLDLKTTNDFCEDPYSEILDLIIKHEIKIVSFTFGCLTPQQIRVLHLHGVFLIGTATTVKEAIYLEKHKVDAIVLQGIEAGGHRGSFLKDRISDNLPLHTLFTKVKKELPLTSLIVTGGLYNGAQAREYIENGAQLALYGSMFIPSMQSSAMAYHKNLLDSNLGFQTRLTKSFSGKWARGIVNSLMNHIDFSGLEIPKYPIQNFLTQSIRQQSKKLNKADYYSLWCGENAKHAYKADATQILNNLIQEFYSHRDF